MSLKDQILADSHIFLNLNEFADMHNLNGLQVSCVLDEDTDQKRNGGQSEQWDGIFLSTVKVFVNVLFLPKKPAQGKLFKLDNKPYTVIECSENAGMYEILLGLNGS